MYMFCLFKKYVNCFEGANEGKPLRRASFLCLMSNIYLGTLYRVRKLVMLPSFAPVLCIVFYRNQQSRDSGGSNNNNYFDNITNKDNYFNNITNKDRKVATPSSYNNNSPVRLETDGPMHSSRIGCAHFVRK